MDRNKKIIKNTIIFAIGNFGSKILTFIMVLVYTHFIDPSSFGYYDLVLTTVSLLQPIILMAFDEGIYRWLIDGDGKDIRAVISTCTKFVFTTSIICIIVIVLLNFYFHFQYIVYIILYILTNMIYQILLNAVRGMTENKTYAISGILNTFVMLIIKLPALIFFHMGVEALFIALWISNAVSIAYLLLKQKTILYSLQEPFNKDIFRSILNYSAPLVPNQVSWWIVNSSDRYIILFFLGTSFNGIYSVSNKFPTVVTTITGIIYFALQETIIKEYNSPDRDQFYSDIFKNYYVLLFSLISCGIPLTKIVIELTVSASYVEAWRYMPFLYFSTVFSALSSLLGIGYQISKETSRSVRSTIAAAGVNIVVNISMIKFIGLHAASFSTFVAYLVLFLVRVLHSKKYFTLTIDLKRFIGMVVLASAISVLTFIGGMRVNIVIAVVAILISMYLNKSFIRTILSMRKKETT